LNSSLKRAGIARVEGQSIEINAKYRIIEKLIED